MNLRPLPYEELLLKKLLRWSGGAQTRQIKELQSTPTASQGLGARLRVPPPISSISADGMLTLVGRVADAISTEGAFISPEQIERELSGYPGLVDVAVVGIPQAGGNQEIWIGVMTQGPVDEQAIKDFLLKKNPRWRIAHVKVLDRIRRNDMGKIVRARIREKLLAP